MHDDILPFKPTEKTIKIISLGGLSDCGKSSAGIFFESLGIKRLKIVTFEEIIMKNRGFDTTKGLKDEYFEYLYLNENKESTLKEFLELISKYMIENNIAIASLESMYRPEMVNYLKGNLRDQYISIFIEAPLEKRLEREWNKRNRDVDFNELTTLTIERDLFKNILGASEVKWISDYVIDNSGSESLLHHNLEKAIESLTETQGTASTIKKKRNP